MKKTVVIVGAGLEQIRAYKVAKSLGYSTIATDIDKKAPAFEFSDYQLIFVKNVFKIRCCVMC